MFIAPGDPAAAILCPLIRALGAEVQLQSATSTAGSARCVAGNIVTAKFIESMDADTAVALLRRLRNAPLLMHGLDAGGRVRAAVMDSYAIELETARGAPTSTYHFSQEEMVWPLGGTTLRELTTRTPVTVALGGAGMPIISTADGCVFGRLSDPAHQLYLTTVALPDQAPSILQRVLSSGRFVEVFPALIFVRHVLGEAAWKRPLHHANVVVDDPNLRCLRYGHLDFAEVIRVSREHPFHLSPGFVPMEYRSTAPHVADYFSNHSDRLSLVMHGNDHLKREMARPVSDSQAAFTVRQALARMKHHEHQTGLPCPRVMTMPHGASTPQWVKAMADAGYAAALSGRSYAFTDSPEAEGAPPLLDLLPAEMSLFGFPMINRYPLEQPLDEALFAAWFGKPTCLYTHQDFFANWDRLIESVDQVNRWIQPLWTGLQELVEGNYTARRLGTRLEVMAYSNELTVIVPDSVTDIVFIKAGGGMTPENTVALINGQRVQPDLCSNDYIRLSPVEAETAPKGRIKVRFSARSAGVVPPGWQRTALGSRARRILTEARDRLAPVLS